MALGGPGDRRVIPIDANSSAVEWVERLTNAASRGMVARSHRYVEVGTGLNYQAPSGQWLESMDLIELTDDGGAAALRGPHKVHFNPNLNTQGVIALTTVSNRVFRSHPLALYYFNTESGQSALIARVKDSIGELHRPNQLVYPDCLEGAAAEYRVTCTKAGLEADLVLTAQLPPPETFFGAVDSRSVRLEWITEFLDAPNPKKSSRTPDTGLMDEVVLDFGEVWLPSGRAFLWEGSTNSDSETPAQIRLVSANGDTNQVSVAKRWLRTSDGRTVLVESVNWQDIAPKLESLPHAGRVASAADLKAQVTKGRTLPATKIARRQRANHLMRVASRPYVPKGFVMDYVIWSVSQPTIFQSGETYYIDSPVYIGDALTFQPGCIIKFAYNSCLLTSSGVYCNGSSSNPSIFTSKDDDLFGDKILGSTGNPTYAAAPAIWLYYLDWGNRITGVKIRWAQTAIKFDSNSSSVTHTFQDSRLEQCQTGLYANNCSVAIVDSSHCAVSAPAYGYYPYEFIGSLTYACNGDTDSDGLPDGWETAYFGNLTSQNGTADPDGDGLTNVQEYQGGANPMSPDLLKIFTAEPKINSNIP